MRRLAALLPLLVVAACDTGSPETLTFGGVEVATRGDASLAVEGGALVVSGLSGNRSGGFDVAGSPDRVDVLTAPVSIPAGGRFGIEVEDSDGNDVASIYNEGTGNGRFDVRVAFADVLGVETVTVRYRLNGRVVFTIPSLPLVSDGSGRLRARSSAGSTEDEPESVHVIRENGRYIVVSDSEGAPDNARGGCSGFVLDLPFEFGSDFPNGLCTDWIEIEPNGSGAMPTGRVAVTARGVGSFRVRSLSASGGTYAD